MAQPSTNEPSVWDVRPCAATADAINARPPYAVLLSQSAAYPIFIGNRTNGADNIVREFRSWVARTLSRSPVNNAISRVLLRGRPTQVADVVILGVSIVVRDDVGRRRLWRPEGVNNKPVHEVLAPLLGAASDRVNPAPLPRVTGYQHLLAKFASRVVEKHAFEAAIIRNLVDWITGYLAPFFVSKSGHFTLRAQQKCWVA